MPHTNAYPRPLPFWSILALVLGGCGHSIFQRPMSEGVIEYALSFPDMDPNGLMAGMLPERTTLFFSDNRQTVELSAGMGLFKTLIISDNQAHRIDYHLSVMGKKLMAEMGDRDALLISGDAGAMTLIQTNEVDTISGLPCRKAVAIFDEIGTPEVELYYTDRIQMGSPNWFGPFHELDGVLLRYDLVQHGVRMRLNAVSVTPGPVQAGKFTPLDGHQRVSPEQLSAEIREVLSAFDH